MKKKENQVKKNQVQEYTCVLTYMQKEKKNEFVIVLVRSQKIIENPIGKKCRIS